MLIVGNGRVITRDAEKPYLEHGAVAIDGDTIVAVGDEAELKAANPGYEYVDAHGGVIMPGLVNCHTHIYSGLARGLAIDGCNPTNFLENLEQQWWKIDDNLTLDGTRASAYATILDSLRDGVTTIFDHHASFCEIPGSLFAIKDVAAELGMRSCLCYEVSDRRGPEKRDQSIAENAEFARWAHDAREKDNDTMIAAMHEARKVGACQGVLVTQKDLYDYLALLDTMPSDAMPSMAQDALAHRPSEVEAFAGTVLELAKFYGMQAPVNQKLYDTIREMEANW